MKVTKTKTHTLLELTNEQYSLLSLLLGFGFGAFTMDYSMVDGESGPILKEFVKELMEANENATETGE